MVPVAIVNDDKKKIRYHLSGLPGSAHDQRVFSNVDLYQDPSAFLLTRKVYKIIFSLVTLLLATVQHLSLLSRDRAIFC